MNETELVLRLGAVKKIYFVAHQPSESSVVVGLMASVQTRVDWFENCSKESEVLQMAWVLALRHYYP